jgi:hypothetical protein
MTNNRPNSFVEGESYPFSIFKKIRWENKECFVLIDRWERKLLLDASPYPAYNLRVEENIQCRIDKINCSGKIFLEPEHPLYKEKGIYDFKIKKIEEITDKFGDRVYALHMDSETEAIARTSNTSNYKIDDIIRCKIGRLKKGIIYLQIQKEMDENGYEIGQSYPFYIEKISKLKDEKEYFILRDKTQEKFLLDCDFYKHYKLKVGNTIRCIIIKYSSKFYFFLEPEHPFYKIGENYDFEFIRYEKTQKTVESNSFTVYVKDVFGEETMFTTYRKMDKEMLQSKKIKCTVLGLKKGKAMLVIL